MVWMKICLLSLMLTMTFSWSYELDEIDEWDGEDNFVVLEGKKEGIDPQDVKDILNAHCWKCHRADGAKNSQFDVFDVKRMIDKEIIVPKKPKMSPLYDSIA